jgi:group I intron endonuclease
MSNSAPGIYKITNILSNKVYVGCASNIRTRWNDHLYDLRKGQHCNYYLQKAWLKHGESNFKFEIIELCGREYYWAEQLECLNKSKGYNLKPINPLGCPTHSEETKEKLRIANSGKKPSMLCIQRLKERVLSEEHKKLLMRGRQRINFKEVHRAKKGKKIINIETNVVYGSLSELCEKLNVSKGTLSRKLSGKRSNNTNFKYI